MKLFKKLACLNFPATRNFSVDIPMNSSINSKLHQLQNFGVSKSHLQFFNYLNSLPLSEKISQEAKIFEELFSQIFELFISVKSETPDTEDYRFFKSELEATLAILDNEYQRVLPQAVEVTFSTEIDRIEGARLEFRAGVGGSEALLFADEMSEYYSSYLANKGYRIEVISTGQHGGKVVAFKAKGEGVYKHIIHECGVHKVIRVPETETKGRLHSSTISIVVLPDVPFEFKLIDKELRYEYMRAQGPGGQHVNKTESACRVTHIPTGITVMMQDDRSQANNKKMATELIRDKLYQLEFDKKMGEEMAKRKTQIGSGDRSDKIRTYNFPQDRITDHRLGKTVYGIKNGVVSGDIFDECIEEMKLLTYKQTVQNFNEMLNEKFLI